MNKEDRKLKKLESPQSNLTPQPHNIWSLKTLIYNTSFTTRQPQPHFQLSLLKDAPLNLSLLILIKIPPSVSIFISPLTKKR